MNKEDIQKFIKDKKIVETAKKYWWNILLGVVVLIFILGYAFDGSSDSTTTLQETSEVSEDAVVSYIMHPDGDEAEYPVKFLMDHVVPSQTAGFIGTVKLIQNPLADLREIEKMMRFSKLSDQNRFGVRDYWQTPAEVLVTKEGDNEDWANTFVSAAIFYDPSFKCYVLALETILTSFCYVGNNQYSWMDDEETRHSRTFKESDTEEMKMKKIQEMLDMYSKRYRVRAGEKLQVLFAYNDKDFVKFANNQEFIDWALALSE